MEPRVLGFIGLGRMGGLMAARLADAGYPLYVFDRNPVALAPLIARGAVRASSPVEVASRADTVLVCLPTPDVVHDVALGEDGIAWGSRARTLIDLGTTGPVMATRLAAGLLERGITLADAPVTGGLAGAKAGRLSVMVSCPAATFAEIEPIVGHLGRVFYTGEAPGLAQVAKLANNLLSAAALAVSSEAMAMGVKAGIDPQILLDIINASSGRNSATEDKFPQAILPGTFDFGMSTALFLKDVRLCLEKAASLGVPMVVGAAVRELFTATRARFGDDSDFTCVAKLVEEWAHVQIRGR